MFFNTWSMTGRWLALPEGKVRSPLIPHRWRACICNSIYRLLNLSASEGKRNCRLVWSLREFSPVSNFADFAVSSSVRDQKLIISDPDPQIENQEFRIRIRDPDP